jgi:hypothetical protein
MKKIYCPALVTCLFPFIAHFSLAQAQPATTDQPYKVVKSAIVGGAGGWDYVYADAENRRLYIPRGDRITVFDLDTLESVGMIPGSNSVHGVTVDPISITRFAAADRCSCGTPRPLR